MPHTVYENQSQTIYLCTDVRRTCTRLPTLPPLGLLAMRLSLMRPASRLPNRPPSSRPDTRKAADPASATPLACRVYTWDDFVGIKIAPKLE